MSFVKGCAGSSDGCRGCGPCVSQHSAKAADIHDKPGQSLVCSFCSLNHLPGSRSVSFTLCSTCIAGPWGKV